MILSTDLKFSTNYMQELLVFARNYLATVYTPDTYKDLCVYI